ncbi:hypothetical protein [Devosia sp.]|uniref:hypothetical protein n=1 Tax=Devosia sp. TaxID=1871048 RepID=UPI0027363BEE|nr:hypothetical protein [Devosia sp.]MDP2781560.1 hypothetical protein [Devosia sp.]
MTHHGYNEPHRRTAMSDIITAEEARPGLLRQIGNGIGGLIVLLLTGLVLMIAVLWKSP